jgi:hypothetical protein
MRLEVYGCYTGKRFSIMFVVIIASAYYNVIGLFFVTCMGLDKHYIKTNKTLCGALTRWGYTSHTNTHITKRKSRIRAQKV